ncbi:histone-like protein 18C [Drosophila eugracilis]|uniref:histone-like protein 18C n=1 Tax=Drosophila eugracilis TaxID=29029 RepID=UPI0007E769F9|nr:histone-like protein 18C [Drosophila eugracilis]
MKSGDKKDESFDGYLELLAARENDLTVSAYVNFLREFDKCYSDRWTDKVISDVAADRWHKMSVDQRNKYCERPVQFVDEGDNDIIEEIPIIEPQTMVMTCPKTRSRKPKKGADKPNASKTKKRNAKPKPKKRLTNPKKESPPKNSSCSIQ